MMETKKFVGITGSELIGVDPFDPKAWSGSSKRFFEALRDKGMLARAFGGEVGKPLKCLLMLKNLATKKELVLAKTYLDPWYYEALTGVLKRQLTDEDFSRNTIQLGAIYNIPKIVNGRSKCFSYHDGNVVMFSRSPYFPKNISPDHVSRAAAYEKSVYDGLEKIFTMSDYLRESFIEDFKIPANRVVQVGAGINFDSMPDIQERDWSLPSILFVGRDFHRKGGEQILRAFKKVRSAIPGSTLHLVGPRSLPSGIEVADGVINHGSLDKQKPDELNKLEQLYRTATVFVLPSLFEPYGIAAIEAMAYGMPCVLSDAWAFPEMVTPGIHGALIPPGNDAKLAEAIIDMLRDPDQLAQMGAAARRRVEADFTWAKVADRIFEATNGVDPV
jgi:alpha-maltose-1-phosphate synthase